MEEYRYLQPKTISFKLHISKDEIALEKWSCQQSIVNSFSYNMFFCGFIAFLTSPHCFIINVYIITCTTELHLPKLWFLNRHSVKHVH